MQFALLRQTIVTFHSNKNEHWNNTSILSWAWLRVRTRRDLNDLYKLQNNLRSSKMCLSQKDRALLIDLHKLIVPNALPSTSSSSPSSSSSTSSSTSSYLSSPSPSGVSSITEQLEQLDLEEEKLRCFCGLVYRTTVHPTLIKALESTDVYKWYPEPEHCTITAFGTSSKHEFRNKFSEVWDQEKDNNNGFKFLSEQVLSFIKYVETAGSTVSPCAIQGTDLPMTSGNSWRISSFWWWDETLLYTAAHCIENPTLDKLTFIETDSIPCEGSMFAMQQFILQSQVLVFTFFFLFFLFIFSMEQREAHKPMRRPS